MPDPDLEVMQEALRRIQKLSDDHWWALHPTCTLMENDAWVGPTGRRFGKDVHADQQALRDMLTKAVEEARAKVASLAGRR
ncbi:hypothetical protein [Nonomuraea sp. NPDC049309]|jgi:hypothetical protein|uniref:hypothetical protein n=1 Tax=Nonomuraea sp. NPDC049309 TaxID=3364350 RepID=UPI003718896B